MNKSELYRFIMQYGALMMCQRTHNYWLSQREVDGIIYTMYERFEKDGLVVELISYVDDTGLKIYRN